MCACCTRETAQQLKHFILLMWNENFTVAYHRALLMRFKMMPEHIIALVLLSQQCQKQYPSLYRSCSMLVFFSFILMFHQGRSSSRTF